MLPDGEYVMSQEQVARAIDIDAIYIRRFLASDALKTLSGKDFTKDKMTYQDSSTGRGKSGRINVVPLEVATAFWVSQGNKGNAKASALVSACAMEALERRYEL